MPFLLILLGVRMVLLSMLAACGGAHGPSSAFTKFANKYPLHYVSGPTHLPGTTGRTAGQLKACFDHCAARHAAFSREQQQQKEQQNSNLINVSVAADVDCVGFTACSKSGGPNGCYLYADIGAGALADSQYCDWYQAPWCPGPVPPLCQSGCAMVSVLPPNTYYTGTFSKFTPNASAHASVAACSTACLAVGGCVAMTFSVRPSVPCVLYDAIHRETATNSATTAAVRCKVG